MQFRLKPKRDGYGEVTAEVIAYNITEFWSIAELYVKIGHRYEFFQARFESDICGYMDGTVKVHPLSELFFKQILKRMKNLLHKCPYDGPHGFSNVKIGMIGENIVPNILPRGTYKLTLRFYKKSDNETYAFLWVVAEIEAVDVIKNYQLG